MLQKKSATDIVREAKAPKRPTGDVLVESSEVDNKDTSSDISKKRVRRSTGTSRGCGGPAPELVPSEVLDGEDAKLGCCKGEPLFDRFSAAPSEEDKKWIWSLHWAVLASACYRQERFGRQMLQHQARVRL